MLVNIFYPMNRSLHRYAWTIIAGSVKDIITIAPTVFYLQAKKAAREPLNNENNINAYLFHDVPHSTLAIT